MCYFVSLSRILVLFCLLCIKFFAQFSRNANGTEGIAVIYAKAEFVAVFVKMQNMFTEW